MAVYIRSIIKDLSITYQVLNKTAVSNGELNIALVLIFVISILLVLPLDAFALGPEDCTSSQVWQNNECVDAVDPPKNDLGLQTDQVLYRQGDVIVISGKVPSGQNTQNYIQPFVLENPQFVNAFGSKISDNINVNQQVQIVADVKNNQEQSQKFVYVVQVKNQNGIIVSLGWLNGSLNPGQTLSPALSWTQKTPDAYVVEIFVWDVSEEESNKSWQRLNTLATPLTLSISDNGYVSQSSNSVSASNGIQDVAIIVKAPDNNIVAISQISPNADGSFQTNLKADGPQFKLPGKYTILVNSSGLKSETAFEFTGGTGDIAVDDTKPLKNDLNLQTDKVRYGQGDTVVISGMIHNIENLSTGDVAIIVRAPDNNIVTITMVHPNADGSFQTSLDADGPQFKLPGKYTILANFSGLKSTITFEFTGGSGDIISGGDTSRDTDGDYISDSSDSCPTDPETVNGYQDTDGCPDAVPPTDTDGDGISDSIDQCPTQNETVNGYDDLDGCPDIVPIPTTDDLPYEITIKVALNSGSPGCEETSQGCFIPKSVSVAAGGTVIFSNTDTAAHTFTAGTAAEGPSGEFDTSLVMAGSSYEWTATTVGEFPYYCMVHPWMAGILFVGEGTYIPPQPEDDFDLQVIMENQVYDLSDTATMNLYINGISTPQNVALEISDPKGTTVISRSFEIDSQGVSFEFRIDENFKTGTYKVVATTSDNGNTVSDTAYFKVISQYNSFKITSVQVTDQQGNPSNLQAGEMGFIKVNLEANKSITTLVTVNLFDSDLTSIGIGSIKTTLSSGNSEIILSFMIPSDVSVGPADIYVNAFSDWPSNDGIPLTGEISITENIE
jgi:hypothetical protein